MHGPGPTHRRPYRFEFDHLHHNLAAPGAWEGLRYVEMTIEKIDLKNLCAGAVLALRTLLKVLLRRFAPQIVAVQIDKVEGVEEYAFVSALVPDEIERGHALVITGDSFAVDDARPRAQPRERINDQREATSEVIAGSAKAVVLNFVRP